MVKKLLKTQEIYPTADFIQFIRNNLNQHILNGINYPASLALDSGFVSDIRRREHRSYTINRVFERCAERFNEVAGRPVNGNEAYLLAKEVANFVEHLRK